MRQDKIMITLRLTTEQYNELVAQANDSKTSLNTYCLQKLAVSNIIVPSGMRGKRPQLRDISE